MQNAQIAAVFEEIADLLELKGENPFRVRAYRNAARTIGDLPESVADLLADPQRKLTDISGIGKDLAEKIAVLVATGELPMHRELLAETSSGVLDLMRVPGLGPRRAATVYRGLGVKSLDDLRAACESGRLRALKGFGPKIEEAILAGLEVAAAAHDRIYWAQADEIVAGLRRHMESCPDLGQLEFAGSYRRGRETVGDLDVLAASTAPAAVMDHFAQYPAIAAVLLRGETKMSVRLERGLQVDLRVVEEAAFGAALQYFTGSKEHNVVLRGRAKRLGLKINEYGVFRAGEGGDEYVAGRSEAEVYGAVGLPCFPPELREARREFDWADRGALPELIVADDLVGDLHMHTDATDGRATLDEMAAAARQRGRKYIAITDHSQRVAMAGGLNAERLLAQWRRIDRLNESLQGKLLVLKGIECDILERGGMDLPDEVLAQADWVIASVHFGQNQPRAQITRRIVQAIENPHVHLIAHPTGRLLLRRNPYEVDLDEVIAAAREHGKILELNANPARLDLNDVHCAAAKEAGVMIAINTDAHSTHELDLMRYGVLQARRGGLTRQDVANTRDWPQLKALLGRRR